MYLRLPDRIRAARGVKHWSQAELANQLGVHASAVGHWERGAGNAPSTARLFALAQLTGTNVQWLAVGTGPMLADDTPTEAAHTPVLSREEERLLRCFRRLAQGTQEYVLAFAEHQVAAIGVSTSP